jgi:hypothetical protein
MFRPAFNDVVNESMLLGCNSCILSGKYLADQAVRREFQRIHAQDANSTLWFELQRQQDYIMYQRIDFVDIMMRHPDAWSFPETVNVVCSMPGEPIDPFHGWLAQRAANTGKETADIDFKYSFRIRTIPERTFQAMALGRIPEFVQSGTHAEPVVVNKSRQHEPLELDEAARVTVEENDVLLMRGGLGNPEDVYVTLDDLRREGIVGRHATAAVEPDVLDCKVAEYPLKGRNALQVFLRSRGNPDNMKQTLISPKQIKDMASQLGIQSEPTLYWYAMFALRYPLAPEWEVTISGDTRWYINLQHDRPQPVHPMINRFREHLDDCKQNEFLWDHRGFTKFKCSECGIPEAVVWCPQCTDYFCADDFLARHKSARGKRHWPIPVPGCRYLSASQAARMSEHIPLLNVGFSNRRRFLAPEGTSSDKNGSRNGDPWLFFHADTFQDALMQAPEKHWYLKRLKPPRLGPGAEGYYYNFANDVIADDASYILSKAHEQKALVLLQKNIRMQIVRRRLKREEEAVKIIQKNKVMWDVQKIQGKNGQNTKLLRSWYLKFKTKQDRQALAARMYRLQAAWKGYVVRKDLSETTDTVRRFQSAFRGILERRRHATLLNAVLCIQRTYRGHLFARRRMREEHKSARSIQGAAHGLSARKHCNKTAEASTYIQAHAKGYFARKLTREMKTSAVKIQRNWRRFQAQLHVKIVLYDRMDTLYKRRLAFISHKKEECGALLIQRNWRRHRDLQKTVRMRREKAEGERLVSSMLVALYTGASELRHHVHPYWRHLPVDIQEVLSQIKASLQRTIGLVPIRGKLASEELGQRSLRVGRAEDTGADGGRKSDLASHMLISVSRHMLAHLPVEVFSTAVEWACYGIAHQAVAVAAQESHFPREIVPVGKELTPHPADKLNTLYEDTATIRHPYDWLISLPDESLPLLMLSGLPNHHRHVYVTAQVLITMRQALEQPSLSTEDHLKFHGLDANSGAQMMEVLSSELDHRLPSDWPKNCATVAALAGQMNSHITSLSIAKQNKNEKGSDKASVTSGRADSAIQSPTTSTTKKNRGTQKASDRKQSSKKGQITEEKVVEQLQASLPIFPEATACSSFNRRATLRVLQQVAFFMDIHNQASEMGDGVTTNIRQPEVSPPLQQNRYLSVTDKLFEMADRAPQDHCSFALAVVLYHMVLRALLLRVVYHRAAVAVQNKFRYIRSKGQKQTAIAPAILIQRCWRGVRTGLLVMRQDDAAEQIQRNFRAWRWNRRANHLLGCTLKIQRVWHSAVHRRWLRHCHIAAREIQRHMRGLLVRRALDAAGRDLVRSHQAAINEVLRQRDDMADTELLARTAALAAKTRVALHIRRERNVDLHRLERSVDLHRLDKRQQLALKGAVQPARLSIFEPMIFATARLEPRMHARYGAKQSRVLMQVAEMRKSLERSLPPERRVVRLAPSHAAAKRGRAAIAARRQAKKPVSMTPKQHADTDVDEAHLRLWMCKHLGGTR